ncbi:MAG: VOC family protein [Actinomycetota bacterium]
MHAPLDQRLSIITIAVDDLEVARDFYNQVFGWTPVEASEEEAANIAFYQLNGFMLALYPLTKFAEEHGADVARPAGFTLAYNVNSTEEVDAVFDRLRDHEVTILKEPELVFWGGYSGYVAGPSGEQWEIAYSPYTSVNEDGTFG